LIFKEIFHFLWH